MAPRRDRVPIYEIPSKYRFKTSPIALKIIEGDWTDDGGKNTTKVNAKVLKIRRLIRELDKQLTKSRPTD